MRERERTQEEIAEQTDRLCEDIRRAMNGRQFDRAAKLALDLTAALSQDEWLLTRTYPTCLECNGYAEVVDPEHPEKKVSCAGAPAACPGNGGGRMRPEQYQAYLDARLQPTKPTVVETIPTYDADGHVPRLPNDPIRPTVVE